MNEKEAWSLALERTGTNEMAAALGLKPETVIGWKIVPAKRALQVARLSGVSVFDLAGDVFGTETEMREYLDRKEERVPELERSSRRRYRELAPRRG